MDSLTHIALGAVVGEALAGPRIRRTMLFGAIAQSIPDIDFLAGLWMDIDDNLLAHRGFTHSLLFMATVSLLCALIMDRWYRSKGMSLRTWGIFFFTEMAIHLLLDSMNVYGVGLFQPFSMERVSFNVLFVADPLFSLLPGIGAFVLLFLGRQHKARRAWTMAGWTVPAVYLTLAIVIKLYMASTVRTEMARREFPPDRYFVTPTMMNIMLWYIVVQDNRGYHIAFRSVFDDGEFSWRYHERREVLLAPIAMREDVQNLIKFSEGYYVMSSKEGRPVLSDLRFGQVFGWNNPDAPFVFNYDLGQPDNNALVIQRGRFTDWTRENLRLTAYRIAGR